MDESMGITELLLACASSGGLTVEEAAEVLGISADTVTRHWKLAKVWLLREPKRSREPQR
jgi:predicted ArsR family transcriptional regulator